MYIHGGYWRSLDKKRFSFVAPALAKAGITVAVPDYALCPAVQVEDIVMQMFRRARGCTVTAEISARPRTDSPCSDIPQAGISRHDALLPLAGLLAGLAEEGRQRRDVDQRLVRPDGDRQGALGELRRAPRREVRTESEPGIPPARHPTHRSTPRGRGGKRGIYIQNRLIAEKWGRVHRRDIPCPGKNHFTVLDQVCDTDSGLFKAMLEIVAV